MIIHNHKNKIGHKLIFNGQVGESIYYGHKKQVLLPAGFLFLLASYLTQFPLSESNPQTKKSKVIGATSSQLISYWAQQGYSNDFSRPFLTTRSFKLPFSLYKLSFGSMYDQTFSLSTTQKHTRKVSSIVSSLTKMLPKHPVWRSCFFNTIPRISIGLTFSLR